ncbi:MAG: hypothetical protein WC285_04705 [Candidatus Gracilibacteria bacterium]|jgi:hypothetical protein
MIKKTYLSLFVITGIFVFAVLVYFTNTENFLNSVISTSKAEEKCQTKQTTTFIKSYSLKDSDLANSVSLTSDGGYILTGGTMINKYMSDSDAFIMKFDSKGKKEWANSIQSKNNVEIDPLIAKAGDDRGHAVTQLSDGNYILVGETNGFLTDELYGEQEFSGDILISKFDAKGKNIWTETLMGLSLDIPVNIVADNNGGFFLSAAIAEVGYEGADFLHHFVIGKFDGSGKKIWIKKTNLLSWDPLISDTKLNQSFLKDSDGNILLTGMIAVQHESNEYDNGDESEAKSNNLAVIIKLGKNGETLWTKSLEGIPVKLNGVSSHVRAGSFYAIEQTEDKGYLVFGLLSPLITGGTRAKIAKPEYLAAIKLDKNGNYKWAKIIGIGAPLTGFFTAKTKDDGFVFIKNYKAWNNKSDADYNNYVKTKKAESALNIDVDKGTIDLPEEADVNLDKILAIKTDKDFNVQWAKKIGVGKEFFGFDVEATPDQGIVIAGLQRNSTVREVNHGQTFYYDDILLVKLDANGNIDAKGGQDGSKRNLISTYSAITAEDMSVYITATDFTPEIENDNELTVNQQNPTISPANVKPKDLSAPKSYKASICPLKSQTKTWAKTNFDNTKKIDKIAEGKGQEVHEEILPILERIFTDAKITDNIGGFSLEYVVGRLVTQEDMQAIQKELETLGYTTYSKDTDQLIMKKIGRMLVIVFSTNDRMRGIITVSF